MTFIREILQRPVDQRIAEVIQVTEDNDEAVYEELTEYVVTKGISDRYRGILDAIATSPSEPPQSVGVWVSGFFGSGKSSFAKNLGYVLMNRTVLNASAVSLFKDHFSDRRVPDLIDSIVSRIPIEAVMFDVQKEKSLISGNESIALILYVVILRHLGYAEDIDIAELEIELEEKDELARFGDLCQATHGRPWETLRKAAQKLNYASAVLHQMDAVTYPEADTWARSLAGRRLAENLTISRVVSRVFDLMARRRPGRALLLVIDEVGAYVAASVQRLEDLRALVEEFGKVGRARLRAKQVPAPTWLVVTSQEKLDEVVNALDLRRVELARVQDRFEHRIDLAPEDIREVATRRLLSKTDHGAQQLRVLFKAHEGRIKQSCQLENSSIRTDLTEDAFVQFYPYLPHYIDLSIDIMSGIRLAQPGTARHLGGSNRTIIKQAHEMLVNERTAFAKREVGALVSLDRIYDLVEGNFPSELQKDIADIEHNIGTRPGDGGWSVRVAKVLALLELVRDVPRTPNNLASFLVDEVGQLAPAKEVAEAIVRLKDGQFVRETEEGFKLQTRQEKSWDAERRGYLEPRLKDRNDIRREILSEVFSDASVRTFRYENMKTFRVGLSVDDVAVGDPGQITVSVLTADDVNGLPAKIEESRSRSRPPATEFIWALAMTNELDDLVAQLYASRRMVSTYTQRRAQEQITPNQAELLRGEQAEEQRIHKRLRDRMTTALEAGTGVFQGVARDGTELGKTFAEMIRAQLNHVVPVLYPKLAIGARSVRGTEAEEVLKAANLNGLSQVFYDSAQGLGLVRQDGEHWVPNLESPVAKEVFDYLRREQSYGNKVTGKSLEQHLGGPGYGWELDVIRVILAVLLRAGTIEVTHQGRRYRNHQDPQSRVPLTSNPAFRAASFAPRESAPTLKDLTRAVEQYEQLTGGEVDVEESSIAAALKRFAREELEILVPVEAMAKAHRLDPYLEALTEYRATLEGIDQADTDDAVRILAGEGQSLRAARDELRKVADALKPESLQVVQAARRAVDEMYSVLALVDAEGDLQERRDRVRQLLGDSELHRKLGELTSETGPIVARYTSAYASLHERRASAASEAIEGLKADGDWPALPEDLQQDLLKPLQARGCDPLNLGSDSMRCASCGAALSQMQSEIDAMPALQSSILERVRAALAPPDQPVARVRVREFFAEGLDDAGAIQLAVDRLRDHLIKLLDEGARIVLE